MKTTTVEQVTQVAGRLTTQEFILAVAVLILVLVSRMFGEPDDAREI